MSPAKKKKSRRFSARVKKLLKYVRGRGILVAVVGLAGLIILGLIGGWYLVWNEVGDYVLSSESYLVTSQRVEIITAAPEWIDTDIRAEVFRNASLDRPLSIMDDDLTQRIANAFSLHPWVAKVCRVTKHHPAQVQVELVYRRPVCMVEVPGGAFPVDVRGVLLPVDDFSPSEAGRYPRLVGVDTVPVGTVGECWGDVRVVGGAEIAAALGEVWEEFRLAAIIPSAPSADDLIYMLRTRGGSQIRWGPAPSSAPPGELSPADKVARLQGYFANYGTLEGHDASQVLDIRSIRISARPKR